MDNKEQIRNLIANIYDVQKLRIAAGNRGAKQSNTFNS